MDELHATKRTSIYGYSALAAALALTLVKIGRGGGDRDDRGEPTREERIGLEIALLPLHQRGKSRKLVGLGGYLVNAVGNRWDCHADPALRPQAKLQVTMSEVD